MVVSKDHLWIPHRCSTPFIPLVSDLAQSHKPWFLNSVVWMCLLKWLLFIVVSGLKRGWEGLLCMWCRYLQVGNRCLWIYGVHWKSWKVTRSMAMHDFLQEIWELLVWPHMCVTNSESVLFFILLITIACINWFLLSLSLIIHISIMLLSLWYIEYDQKIFIE